jgi:calcineurin-like phosphoesterase family protein
MNRDICIISDTHFIHENILRFTGNDGNPIRPGFDSVDHMNEYMIERWNSVVKPEDIVYHLGDVFIGPKDKFLPLFKQLNGSKRLIVGNHDDAKFMAKKELFTKILMWRMFREFGLLFTHVPVHESSLRRGPSGHEYDPEYNKNMMLNVHGHIHQNESPPGPYRCVCVEQIDYTPVNIEDLRIW